MATLKKREEMYQGSFIPPGHGHNDRIFPFGICYFTFTLVSHNSILQNNPRHWTLGEYSRFKIKNSVCNTDDG